MKYYLYLTYGGVYTRDGLQYPSDIPFDVEGILQGWEFRWEPYLGWGHQPRYLVVEPKEGDITKQIHELDTLVYNLSQPLCTCTDVRFIWNVYWGHDFGGDGAWGSVWEDKSVVKTFVSFPSHRAREKALAIIGKPKSYYSYNRSAKGGIYLLYPEQLDLLERLGNTKLWSRLRGPFTDLLRCW